MTVEIRPAKPEDIPDLAKLLLPATDGIVEAVYQGLIAGLPTQEIVERRFHRLGTVGSYERCHVAAQEGRVVGMMHAYPMDDGGKDPPDPLVPEDRYAVYEPFDYLDPFAAGSFYINTISVDPDFQGSGIGTRFIAQAHERAKTGDFTQVSLIVFEQNKRALALYRRLGFAEVARHAAPKHELVRHGGDVLMMLCPV